MREIPFPDGSFEVVVSCAAIHNLYSAPDRAKTIAEIARVLKPGGTAVIDDIRHHREYAATFKQKGCDARRVGSPLGRLLAAAITVFTAARYSSRPQGALTRAPAFVTREEGIGQSSDPPTAENEPRNKLAMNLGQRRVRARTRATISLLLWFTPVLVVGALWLISSGAETWMGLSALTFLFLGPFLFLPFSLVGLVFTLFAIRGSERPILWILGVSLNSLSVAAAATLLILRFS